MSGFVFHYISHYFLQAFESQPSSVLMPSSKTMVLNSVSLQDALIPNVFPCPLCIFLDPSPRDSVPVTLSLADTCWVGTSGPLDIVPLFPYQVLSFPTWLCGDLIPTMWSAGQERTGGWQVVTSSSSGREGWATLQTQTFQGHLEFPGS